MILVVDNQYWAGVHKGRSGFDCGPVGPRGGRPMSVPHCRRIAWPDYRFVAGILAIFASACASDRSFIPPPLAVAALPGARAQVFMLAQGADANASAASVCSTEAGYCPVPAGTPAGLRCTCEAADGSYVYAGRTGEKPAMPAWADPAMKPR